MLDPFVMDFHELLLKLNIYNLLQFTSSWSHHPFCAFFRVCKLRPFVFEEDDNQCFAIGSLGLEFSHRGF